MSNSHSCICDICDDHSNRTRLVVLTGGPGAGKTTVLDIARRYFCDHVDVLPEAASIIYGGGFPRKASHVGIKAAQRAIFRTQLELESLATTDSDCAVVLCDRGALDGLAYWPDGEGSFWREMGCTREARIAEYDAVIHLKAPTLDMGYNHQNPVRVESAEEALALGRRIEEAWRGHPTQFQVDCADNFLDKACQVISILQSIVPACCHRAVHENELLSFPSHVLSPL